jgi:hypothetical protein
VMSCGRQQRMSRHRKGHSHSTWSKTPRTRPSISQGGTTPPFGSREIPGSAWVVTQVRALAAWHHVYNIERLREAYLACKRNVAAGIDGQTWQAYGQDLERNLKDLWERLAQGTYRAKPVKQEG